MVIVYFTTTSYLKDAIADALPWCTLYLGTVTGKQAILVAFASPTHLNGQD